MTNQYANQPETKNKQAFEAFYSDDNIYQQILDAITDMVLVKGSKSQIIWANKAFRDYYGMSVEELKGIVDAPFNESDYTQQYVKDDAYVFETRKTLEIKSEPVTRYDGEVRFFETFKSPIYDSDGQVVMTVGVSRDISARREVEEKLHRSQYLLEEAQRLAHIGNWELDVATDTVSWSEEIFRIHGLEPSNVSPSRKEQICLIHPEDLNNWYNTVTNAAQQGTSFNLDFRIYRTDGCLRYLNALGEAEVNNQGQVVRLFGTVMDITERKEAEITLKEKSLHLQNINSVVPGVIYQFQNNLLTTESCFTYMSPKVREIFELREDAEIENNNPLTELIHPEDYIFVATSIFEAVSNKTYWCEEFRVVTPSGKVKWIRGQSEPVEAPDGFSLHNGIFIDISARKQQEEATHALNKVTNLIRSSLDFDTILTTAVEEIKNYLDVDRVHFAWYFHKFEEQYWEVVKESRKPELPDFSGAYPVLKIGVFADKLLNLEVVKIDDTELIEYLVSQHFFQELCYKSLLIVPIKLNTGIIGVIACCNTYSIRNWQDSEVEFIQSIMAQLEIALYQAELLKASQIKTQELEKTLQQLASTQAQLVQNEKMSSLGQLVAGVAHEINNPTSFIYSNILPAKEYIDDLLNLIQLYQEYYPQPHPKIIDEIEIIELDFLISDLPRLLDSMQVGAERIKKIVASLRTFSRMDESELKPVNIHEGIDSTLMILQHRLKKQPQRAEIELIKQYDNLPLVECYAGQLNQVFMNLLTNAIDALEEAKIATPQICISSKFDSEQVVIEIADNGSGIPENIQKRIFDPFFTTKPVGKGTGMGLSISYQIITQKHGGTLDCISVPSQGTTFVIKIPLIYST